MDHNLSSVFLHWAGVMPAEPGSFLSPWSLWYERDPSIAQQRTGAKHGECWLLMREMGFRKAAGGGRRIRDALNHAAGIEGGRGIMAATGATFSCHRTVDAERDRAAE